MKKEFCTKFCDVLIWFHKVMKLQSFEFSIRDAIHANVKYISPVVSIHIFVSFTEKGTLQSFMEFLTIFHKLEVRTFWMIKLSWCKWHDSRKFVNYGLHGKLLEFLVNVNFLYDYRGLFFKKNMLLWPQVSFKTIVLTKSDVTRFGIFAKIIFKFSTFLPQSEWPKVEQKSSQNFFWKFLDL